MAQINPQTMIDALQAALLSSTGVSSITVDGQTIRYTSRTEMIKELTYWEKQEKLENKKRVRVGRIRLDNAI